jgi:hypothetical protein
MASVSSDRRAPDQDARTPGAARPSRGGARAGKTEYKIMVLVLDESAGISAGSGPFDASS